MVTFYALEALLLVVAATTLWAAAKARSRVKSEGGESSSLSSASVKNISAMERWYTCSLVAILCYLGLGLVLVMTDIVSLS